MYHYTTPTKAKFFIHKLENHSWVVQGKHELDYDISDTFHDLVIHDLDGELDTQDKQVSWVSHRLNEMNAVFSYGDISKTHKLLLACQWLFESFSGKNELLSFVQTTVVIEILLGDKASSEQVGLGTLLRNRCAYLIGTSQSQRDEILDDFQKIYDVRSKIVHGGKSRLNSVEQALKYKLQWMCRRVIQEEVKLLCEDKNQEG
ncbi:HEPN domain-containing protein [Photobacterium sp. GB-210]|uniref:HEPN domain-containing protein n=1 Tax=Photobacterium sp. GB-210 TaxID=2022104 RepID=UPI001E502ECB|nr:HEPN domain-containing protein [Photobacterium sp. GB-210]